MQMPVERIFISEAGRVGVGTYAPHDPTTADLADLVGSVDLSKVAEFGDEGDPRAWSWSGAVYAASRGVLEMIEILKVKREFLYLLLTLTQEKNVKVSRFPLIYVDETILAHTNLAEFRKFLQEARERGAARPDGDHPGPVHARLPATRRASTRSSSRQPSRRSAKCTSTRTCCTPRRCSRSSRGCTRARTRAPTSPSGAPARRRRGRWRDPCRGRAAARANCPTRASRAYRRAS